MKPARLRALAPLFALAIHLQGHATPDVETLRKLGCKIVEKQGAIVEIAAEAGSFTAAEYRLIGGCASLKKLSLNGRTLTDETLPLLAPLTQLEELSTNGSRLTDAGCRHFAALKSLRSLALWHPSFGFDGFTGAGLAELKALPDLKRLTFAGSTAGDNALEAISQITQLEEFSTWHTAQTQAGNVHLAKLVNLKRLRIGQRLPKWGASPPASFDATTIPIIAKLPALETFEIMEGVFTADDLMPLKKARQLKAIKIQSTDISEPDVTKLRAAMPDVKIDYKPLSADEREATLVKKLKLTPLASPQGN